MRLIRAQIDVTTRCNLKCKHCRAAAVKSSIDLSFSDFKRVVKQCRKMGIKEINISGGEPLLYPHLLEAIEFCNKSGIETSLPTNGTFVTKEYASRLAEAGLDYISVSIDYLDAELHDKLRGKKGTFEKAVNAVKLLVKSGIPKVGIHMVVLKSNVNDISKIAKFSEKLGASYLVIGRLLPSGRGEEIIDVSIDRKQYLELLRWVKKYNEKNSGVEIKTFDPLTNPLKKNVCRAIIKQYGSIEKFPLMKGCIAGIEEVYITPSLDVWPCPHLPLVIGNLKKEKLRDILEKSEITCNLRNRLLKGKCGKCRYKKICGGCRAVAYALTNDYLGEDPNCLISS